MIHTMGLIAAVILPLWNIPLIMKIIKRKSSNDISIYWVWGVWSCLLLMFPSGISSNDIIWKTFNIVNFLLFSCVVIFVVLFRNSSKKLEFNSNKIKEE